MAISRDTISHYFHLPIDRAAKRLNVGLSVFKKQCREIGIQRWPYRKIKSLQTMIADFQVTNQLLLTFKSEFISLTFNHTAYFKSQGYNGFILGDNEDWVTDMTSVWIMVAEKR
ncbi:protein RKD1 [Artemisia annua]|uniref:Protein RKD1 n=1 Tax=Artemisia annua TaxID=35608 RepID=A0A2U1LYW2_ARTAN|nr:protein RKD1 [Artemisia annua]